MNSEDHRQFRDMLARFLETTSPTTEVRRLMATDSGYDPENWAQLCGELGLSGLHIPEQYGGSGFGAVELGIAMEQLGRYLYCGPFFSSAVMAGYALLHLADEEARSALLPGIASGETVASLVLDDLNSPDGVGTHLAEDGQGHIRGEASIVIDAGVADHLLVIARGADGLGLYTVALPANGIQITPRESIDATRKLYRVVFDNAATEHLADVTPRALQTFWDHVCTALSHEMMGGAQHLFDTTVEYTRVRYQFGRPIGSFQGLKHRCADLLLDLEFAKAVTYDAAVCLQSGTGDPWASSMAKAMASDTYIESARAAIQLRGGIGFTWEEDTQLWFKRAKSSEVLLGTPHRHREYMMTLVEAAA